MSWAKENKFLSGVIAVTVVGVGALGYLTYSAMAKYDEAAQQFEQTANEKKRLESLKVYPNAENLKKLQQQREEHLGRIVALQKKLHGMEIPVEQLSPEGFQDRLRASVNAYVTKAAEVRVAKMPDKFFMGFEQYVTQAPKPEAAPALGRELKAIEYVLAQLTTYRVNEFRKIEREELPEESGRPAKKAEPAKAVPGKKTAAAAPDLVTRHPFEITIYCDQFTLQNVINAITTAKSQFYILRNVIVKNEKPAPPAREAGAPPATSEPSPEAAPADPNAPVAPPAPVAAPVADKAATFQFIVGEEKVEATLQIEFVDFAAPPEPAEGKGKKQK